MQRLGVVRYDSATLHAELGKRFRLLDSNAKIHHTPFGTRIGSFQPL
jgi:hypothetical protein